MKYLMAAILLGAFGLTVGCKSELETGYKPEKIGVTSEERRAYYAPAFSPEAAAGAEAQETFSRGRRPTK